MYDYVVLLQILLIDERKSWCYIAHNISSIVISKGVDGVARPIKIHMYMYLDSQ